MLADKRLQLTARICRCCRLVSCQNKQTKTHEIHGEIFVEVKSFGNPTKKNGLNQIDHFKKKVDVFGKDPF